MAEHVGIKNSTFLKHVHSMLKDDGMFYIQMCGVREHGVLKILYGYCLWVNMYFLVLMLVQLLILLLIN